jgi:hypothetical protein
MKTRILMGIIRVKTQKMNTDYYSPANPACEDGGKLG